MIFQQDNASIHTARTVTTWFQERGISTSEWPPFSPDLNPIEHLWGELKRRLHEQFPHLIDQGKGEDGYTGLGEAIIEVWDSIPQSYMDDLIRSMDHRINAVILAKGWYTKF